MARTADILVAAIGKPAFVTPDFVKPGAVVIDVGINPVSDEAMVRAWFPPDSPRLAAFAKRGTHHRRRRAPGRGRGRRRAHAGAGRRGPADHRDAARQHRAGRRGPPRDLSRRC